MKILFICILMIKGHFEGLSETNACCQYNLGIQANFCSLFSTNENIIATLSYNDLALFYIAIYISHFLLKYEAEVITA